MVKFITKSVCIALISMLCVVSINAQTERGRPERMPLPQSHVTDVNAADLFNSLRGDDSETYVTLKTVGSVYKGTVTNPFGTVIGSGAGNIQCLEFIDEEIYAVDWAAGGNRLGKISMTNGTWSTIKTNFSSDGVSLCYNPVDGTVYVSPWTGEDSESGIFGTVDLATGNVTTIATYPLDGNHTYFMAIDNDGVAYAVSNLTNQFGTMNLSTGVFTPTATLPFTINFIQNMTVDRETNEIYWLAQSADNGNAYYKVAKNGTVTFISSTTWEPRGFCIISEIVPPPPPCDPIEFLMVNYLEDCTGAELTYGWLEPWKEDFTFNIYRDGDLLVTLENENFYIDAFETGFDATIEHTWEVTVVCEDEESDPVSRTIEEGCTPPPPPCDPIDGETAEIVITCNEATITWDAVEGAIEYKVLKGETLLDTVEEAEYTEEGEFEDGETYTWTIITVCDEDGDESEPVDVTGIAVCDPPAIHEITNNVSIYPNPASGIVNIYAKNFVKVEVYNTVGQLVETRTVNTVDVSNYNTGVYFFKVYDGNNSVTKRIMVAK